MSGSINRIRRRIQERQVGQPVFEARHDEPLRLAHGHTADRAYINVQPVPVNGVMQFTLEQYAELLKTMQQVYDSFLKASAAAKAKKP